MAVFLYIAKIVANRKKEVPIWEKITLTIEEAALYSNIGIGTLRIIVRNPIYPFALRVGKKTLIKRKEFEKYIEQTKEVST